MSETGKGGWPPQPPLRTRPARHVSPLPDGWSWREYGIYLLIVLPLIAGCYALCHYEHWSSWAEAAGYFAAVMAGFRVRDTVRKRRAQR